eukprot:TRINITY_DN3477_c0_g1_i2.p2 TRINITY_DN3477_c0_g1~~TRINITY_DN3477_c0_g1_i2.p2  ORF type:complete len:124 (+),score=0.39 TRINITY_DN3477_c0_g1_i2:851-1222(+)
MLEAFTQVESGSIWTAVVWGSTEDHLKCICCDFGAEVLAPRFHFATLVAKTTEIQGLSSDVLRVHVQQRGAAGLGSTWRGGTPTGDSAGDVDWHPSSIGGWRDADFCQASTILHDYMKCFTCS